MSPEAGGSPDASPVEAVETTGEVEAEIDEGVATAEPISVPYGIPITPVRDAQYNPAEDREDMRKWLGIGIIGTTGLIALIAAIAILAGATDSETLLTGVFTPLIGLSGAVMGFYFGGKDARA